jgi:hypothetical protein
VSAHIHGRILKLHWPHVKVTDDHDPTTTGDGGHATVRPNGFDF